MAEDALFGAAEALTLQCRLEEATLLLERRLSQPSVPTRVYHDLSVLYSQQGFFDLALDSIEKAMERNPVSGAVWCQYLGLQKNNPVQPTDWAWKSMHLQFGDTLRERFDARHLSVARSRDPDARLRVGYMSPDTHPATERFVEPVFQRFDRSSFEVFSYWNHTKSMSKGFTSQDVLHRSIEGMPAERILEQILDDRIDILVDVAGHGAGNALPVLARRPAPIQMTWLDYLATTGLETVDYRITDGVADPPGAEARHVESLLRLDVSQWCYRPPHEAPPIARHNDAREGGVVFGSICVPLKLSRPLLELWAQLLAKVPSSRLRFLGVWEGRARARILSVFERAGIAADRLDILGILPLGRFLSELSGVDVVLDSYPFSGATATLDALWQGVPVVTLAGRLSHSRSSASILAALGKTQWVAGNEDEYLAIAERLSIECRDRAHDRVVIRSELSQSALCDGERFIKTLESGYRKSWREWLRRTASIDTALPYANSRADVLLVASCASASRCRELLDTLPAHKITGQVFWTAFRAADDKTPPSSDRRFVLKDMADIVLLNGEAGAIDDALRDGSRPWIALTTALHYATGAIEGTLPADTVADSDALASFGADAMPHGSLLAAGRGHTGGLTAEADHGKGTVYAHLWIPHRMDECMVLSGQLLLVRRSMLEARRFPGASFKRDVDFAMAVSRFTFDLHREGARLGIVAALVVPVHAAPSAAAQFQIGQALAREARMEAVPQTGVAASALKAIVPAASWPSFVRRAEKYCDRHPAKRVVSLPCA